MYYEVGISNNIDEPFFAKSLKRILNLLLIILKMITGQMTAVREMRAEMLSQGNGSNSSSFAPGAKNKRKDGGHICAFIRYLKSSWRPLAVR